MKQVPVQHRVPPELIEEYERERMEVRLEPGDLENAEPPSDPVSAAEWFLIESDQNRDMYEDLEASVTFELRQRKGTRMLYVVEVSEDGKQVTARASDGSYCVTTGKHPLAP